MKKAVMCIATTLGQAEMLVGRLQQAGFPNDDISVLFPNKDGTKDFAHQHNTKAPEGAVVGVSAGGALGGVLGVLVGIGALAIPGLGPFIAAGPILAGLSGIAAGGAVGGVAGALVGMGFPEIEAKRYEGKIKGGNILLSVHTEKVEDINRARKIFESGNAEDICTTTEASVPTGRHAHHHP